MASLRLCVRECIRTVAEQIEFAIDGLGRLAQGYENIRRVDGSLVNHELNYTYDMLGRLTNAALTNIAGSDWQGDYLYHKDGNLDGKRIYIMSFPMQD